MRRSRIALLFVMSLLPLAAGCHRTHAGSGVGPPSLHGPEVARLRGAKICWATRSEPHDRYQRLASFFSRQSGMAAARASLARRRDALASVR